MISVVDNMVHCLKLSGEDLSQMLQ